MYVTTLYTAFWIVFWRLDAEFVYHNKNKFAILQNT